MRQTAKSIADKGAEIIRAKAARLFDLGVSAAEIENEIWPDCRRVAESVWFEGASESVKKRFAYGHKSAQMPEKLQDKAAELLLLVVVDTANARGCCNNKSKSRRAIK